MVEIYMMRKGRVMSECHRIGHRKALKRVAYIGVSNGTFDLRERRLKSSHGFAFQLGVVNMENVI